ncbi:MAG: hypothetical protein AB7I27_02445 [Bacteriovoracaceae bacterium]
MDIGQLNLFIKLISEEYNLDQAQIIKLSHRILSDEQEFFKIWSIYQNKKLYNGVDPFKLILTDLVE